MLPKRKHHHPLTSDQVWELGARMKQVRLQADADRLDREAGDCFKQARYAEETANRLRRQADDIREKLAKGIYAHE